MKLQDAKQFVLETFKAVADLSYAEVRATYADLQQEVEAAQSIDRLREICDCYAIDVEEIEN